MDTLSFLAIFAGLAVFAALRGWLERHSFRGRYERYLELVELARSHYWTGQEAREELRELLLNGDEARHSLARALVAYGDRNVPLEVVQRFLDEEVEELGVRPYVVYFHGDRLRALLGRYPLRNTPAPAASPARAPADS